MNSEKPAKGIACSKIAIVVAAALVLLVIVARCFFGLSHEITQVAIGLIMVGFLLFGLIDSLRTKRLTLAVILFVCIVLYVVAMFFL